MACTSIMRIWLLIILLCMGAGGIKLCLCNNIEPAEGRRCIESERRALLDVGGDICDSDIDWLSSWRNEGDCCSWRGIGCDNLTGHVTSLDLHGSYDLSYQYLDNLTGQLTSLYLHGSYDLSYQYHMYGISICASKLSPSLFGLTHLKHLDLSQNNFSGAPIPELIGSLVNLEYLNLSYANFGGKVPHQLGNLSNLHCLDFHGGYYYDYAPYAVELHWLSQTTSLTYLDLSYTNLSGAVDWIHDINMKLPSLSVLKLRGCGLSSKVPKLAFDNFTRSLTVLDLSENTFAFPLPTWTWLFNISSLVYLDLSGCGLYGEIPEMIGALRKLEYLDLYYNSINGSLPTAMCNLSSLKYVDLSSNKIEGQIPEGVENLSILRTLWLDDNLISGQMPSSLWRLCSLRKLFLSSNRISGEVLGIMEGSSICKKNMQFGRGGGAGLEYLDLGSNNLTGEFPKHLGQLSSLKYLDLENNSFEGVLREIYFANLTSLEVLFLSYNQFHGTIPNIFANLTSLEVLDLSYNHFHGTIPNIFANLTPLEALDLS